MWGVYQSGWGSDHHRSARHRHRPRPLCLDGAVGLCAVCAVPLVLWPPFVCVGVPCADGRPHVHVFAVNIAHSSSSRLSRRAAHHMRFEDGEDTLVRGAERELPLLRVGQMFLLLLF